MAITHFGKSASSKSKPASSNRSTSNPDKPSSSNLASLPPRGSSIKSNTKQSIDTNNTTSNPNSQSSTIDADPTPPSNASPSHSTSTSTHPSTSASTSDPNQQQMVLASQNQPEMGSELQLTEQAERLGGIAMVGKAGQIGINTSSALVKFATGSTLLPPQIAELVTQLSWLARVSLKTTSFFIELILETAKYSTGISLGITRRALISAVGTARAMHAIAGGEKWDAQSAGKAIGGAEGVRGLGRATNQAFLNILDKYTAVGIYVIHHTFTMAELFAMSGFYLTSSGFRAGISAADESVRMIDGIFGSNETSRALSGFIGLVKRELSPESNPSTGGGIKTLASLTKAFTAFAVLQNATYKRTAKTHKMRVLYDCTVLGEVEKESWRAKLVGSGNFNPGGGQRRFGEVGDAVSSREAIENGNGIPSRGSSRPIQESAMSSGNKRWSRSTRPESRFFDEDVCLTDVQDGGLTSSKSFSPRDQNQDLDENASIMADLDYLVGVDGDEEMEQNSLPTSPEVSGSINLREDQLPDDMKLALSKYGEKDLNEGVVVGRSNAVKKKSPQDPSREVKRIVRKVRNGRDEVETVYEITTEIIETVETTTTIQRPGRRSSNADGTGNYLKDKLLKLPNPFSALSGSSHSHSSGGRRGGGSRTDRDVTESHSGMETQTEHLDGGYRETVTTEEDEWLEVARTTGADESFGSSRGDTTMNSDGSNGGLGLLDESGRSLPEVENGRPELAIAALSRQDTLDHPEDSKARMQVVLKTMTRKLTQKKRIMRQIQVRRTDANTIQDEEDTEMEVDHQLGSAGNSSRNSPSNSYHAFPPVPPSKTAPSSPGTSRKSNMGRSGFRSSPSSPRQTTSSEQFGNTFQRAYSKARSAFTTNNSNNEGMRERMKSSNSSDVTMASVDREHSTPASPLSSPTQEDYPSTPRPRLSVARSPPSSPNLDDDHHQTFSSHSNALPPSTAENGSVRGKKRRNRALSITSMRSFASRSHTHVQTNSHAPTPPPGVGGKNKNDLNHGSDGEPAAHNFPRQHLVKNLHHFMRFSSAAYGQNFMRILGIGKAEYLFADTTKHHNNVWAFAHHVGLPPDNIILSSFTEDGSTPFHSEKMSPIVNYVSIDDESQAIVLACRGSLGLSDMLTDLTCEYEDIKVQGGKPQHQYQVHSGMLASAQRFTSSGSTVFATLKKALEDYPTYGLCLAGHSLGGGVASLLAILWGIPSDLFQAQVLERPASSNRTRHPQITTPFVTSIESGLPPGRPLHAYAYGVPATTSPDLSRYCRGLVTSVVHNYDIVPSLSLGTLRDMRNVAQSLADERDSGDMAQEIVGRVVGLYQRKRNANGKESLQFTRPSLSSLPALNLNSKSNDSNFNGKEFNAQAQAQNDSEIPRPHEAPPHERELTLELDELRDGRTKNRAQEAGYRDPLSEENFGSGNRSGNTSSNDGTPRGPSMDDAGRSGKGFNNGGDPSNDADNDLADWLWSLIKTMRANMDEAKLYPPGQVYCVETFAVYVTPKMTAESRASSTVYEAERLASSRGQAHRVIMREVSDVEKRFREPIFARSMLRDHIPTNYELCTQLLYASVLPREEQTRM